VRVAAFAAAQLEPDAAELEVQFVVDDDDVGVAGNRLQGEPHRVLAHPAALHDRHRRASRDRRQSAPRALHVNLGRGDDDRDRIADHADAVDGERPVER